MKIHESASPYFFVTILYLLSAIVFNYWQNYRPLLSVCNLCGKWSWYELIKKTVLGVTYGERQEVRWIFICM
jgi:hypothetical protein